MGQPRQPDLAAQALSGQAAAETLGREPGAGGRAGPRRDADGQGDLRSRRDSSCSIAEYATLSEQFRTTFTTSRPLFDSGAAALKLLELGIAGSSRRPVAVRRVATTARADDDEKYTVQWRACTADEPFDAIPRACPSSGPWPRCSIASITGSSKPGGPSTGRALDQVRRRSFPDRTARTRYGRWCGGGSGRRGNAAPCISGGRGCRGDRRASRKRGPRLSSRRVATACGRVA
jgi:hypothetical protein